MSEATLRRRRGVVRASITRLNTRLKDLESKIHESSTLSLAHRMSQKLESLDGDFKTHHYALIDEIDDAEEETLAKEQDTLDQHDDDIATLAVRIEQLVATCNSASDSGARKIASRRLAHLKSNLSAVNSAVTSLTVDSAERHLLHQYQEQLSNFKKELADIRYNLLSLGLKEGDDLLTMVNGLDEEIFGCSLQIKKLLLFPNPTSGSLSTSSDGKGVKLPKIDVPTFDGNLLNWQTFWEQFQIAVHDRSSISCTEKLVYLRHALKDGSARSVIEGLSRSGEHYVEAVECLQSHYDRPRLIHQSHVRKITEINPLKEGSRKELRHLHDIAQQHLRGLKAMHHEPTGTFITSLLELKLDQNTIFEWRKFSQKSTDVPHYNELLEFINLRAQASESMVVKKLPRAEHWNITLSENSTQARR